MVLVVDDNDELRYILVKVLRMEGFDVHDVSCAMDAFAFIERTPPHCVVLDLGMPDIDGYGVLTHIRSDPAYADIRVIMYSAYDGSLKDKAMDLGADAFVIKGSLDWLNLRKLLHNFCGGAHVRGRPEAVSAAREREVS